MALLNADGFADPWVFRAMLAEVVFGDRLEVRLHPVDLGFGAPVTASGVPRAADASLASEILERIAELSAPLRRPHRVGRRRRGSARLAAPLALSRRRGQDGSVRAFRMWRDVPLSPEAVDGWRAWSVVEVEGELRLSSLTRAEPWEPATPFVATCPRRGHEAPGRSCSCGVYAAAEPEELARLGRIAGAAIGQVSMWGRIAEHRRGYRAGTAYPSRLRLVCVRCLGEGRGVPAAAIDHDRRCPEQAGPGLCRTRRGPRPSARRSGRGSTPRHVPRRDGAR